MKQVYKFVITSLLMLGNISGCLSVENKQIKAKENILLGAWQLSEIGSNIAPNPADCKRPYYTFSEHSLLELSDADGTPTKFSLPIKEYDLSIPYQILVRFEKNKGLPGWETEDDTVHFIELDQNNVLMQKFKRPFSTLKLYRCPSKVN